MLAGYITRDSARNLSPSPNLHRVITFTSNTPNCETYKIHNCMLWNFTSNLTFFISKMGEKLIHYLNSLLYFCYLAPHYPCYLITPATSLPHYPCYLTTPATSLPHYPCYLTTPATSLLLLPHYPCYLTTPATSLPHYPATSLPCYLTTPATSLPHYPATSLPCYLTTLAVTSLPQYLTTPVTSLLHFFFFFFFFFFFLQQYDGSTVFQLKEK